MSSTAFMLNPAPWAFSSRATSAGVSSMPKRLEIEAAHSAAGTLPRAIEVKAIEDCTVDGRTQMNIRPSDRSGDRNGRNSVVSAKPIAGKRTNVLAKISDCRRQCGEPRGDGLRRQSRAVEEEQ